MMKKPKIKYEESTLNFRVPTNLKSTIATKAQEMNITVSKYLRKLLEEVHDGTFVRKEVMEKERPTFLSSIEFMQLMIWIYQKRQDNKVMETEEQLAGYVRTLKRLDYYLPEEMVKEFDKVLTDLIALRKEKTYTYKRFDFAESYSGNHKFDYDKVGHYLLNLEVDLLDHQGF